MKRRANHEGNIRQRPTGIWEASYRHQGRRHSIYGRDHADVVARLRAALAEAEQGVVPPKGRLTVGAWLDRWLAEHVDPHRRPRTADSYRSTVRLYLEPAIGRVALARLSPDHVAGMMGDLTRRDLSPTTQRYALVVLRIALGRAVKLGLVPRNVASIVDAPRKARPAIHPLTADQVRTLLAATSADRLGPLYAVAVGLGMRQGELLALHWQDLDLEARTLAVRHTLLAGARELAPPKTDGGRRTLRIPASVVAILREQRTRQARERLAAGPKWSDLDYVFTTPLGRPLDGVNVTHAFQRALEAAGLPRQRFRDLRHAYAVLLIERGVELAAISRPWDTATSRPTADLYGAWTREMAAIVAAHMDEVLAG